jgi:hypothetical protein
MHIFLNSITTYLRYFSSLIFCLALPGIQGVVIVNKNLFIKLLAG